MDPLDVLGRTVKEFISPGGMRCVTARALSRPTESGVATIAITVVGKPADYDFLSFSLTRRYVAYTEDEDYAMYQRTLASCQQSQIEFFDKASAFWCAIFWDNRSGDIN